MKNVIIYSDKNNSDLTELLKKEEDFDVRVMNISDLKDARTFNPSLLVFDTDVNKIKDAAMVTKLCAPALIVSNTVSIFLESSINVFITLYGLVLKASSISACFKRGFVGLPFIKGCKL